MTIRPIIFSLFAASAVISIIPEELKANKNKLTELISCYELQLIKSVRAKNNISDSIDDESMLKTFRRMSEAQDTFSFLEDLAFMAVYFQNMETTEEQDAIWDNLMTGLNESIPGLGDGVSACNVIVGVN